VQDVESVPVKPPRGAHQTRCDDKGRLKLPVVFQQYLSELKEQTVFITSVDRRTARIYPISLWKENEILFGAAGGDSEAAARVAFVANHFGADSEVDAQGRVLIPTTLRRHLGIENQPVWLDTFGGRINVYSDTEYEQRLTTAFDGIDDNVKVLERRGLK